MNKTINWLPEKILRQSFPSDYDFLKSVEEAYKNDFVRGNVCFREIPVKRKIYPIRHNGEDASFWHLTTYGKSENSRTRSYERCEKIKWPKAIIENENDLLINVWKEDKRLLLHFRFSEVLQAEKDYIVVLEKRNVYYVLWTAYPIEWEHTRQKFLKRFRASNK